MSSKIGYGSNSDGFFTSGGTLGNLTALLAARQAKFSYDIWTEGIKTEEKPAFFVSKLAHYSIKRAVQIMGFGETSVIPVEVNSEYSMDINDLQNKYAHAISEGMTPVCVAASSCCTPTGSYDDLNAIADFCEQNNLWMHIDGAHGASALLSDKYKQLLSGAERADSIAWDAHKMMLMPALITAVIFKNGDNSYESFSQKASYLFENEAKDEWYNLAHRTMECTKTSMIFKLYGCLKLYGEKFFGEFIDYVYDLTKTFSEIINETDDFETVMMPQANIICFKHIPSYDCDINEHQKQIRRKLLNLGNYYIVQTNIESNSYLRCTIINPLTKLEDLKELLEDIRKIAIRMD
ncbi:MAG: aminotransferase class I/II-fold pyridoxal phosphate-dependent enzyme [bacterium]